MNARPARIGAAALLAALLIGTAGPAAAIGVTRVGNEFQANSTTFFEQRRPDVTALANGQFFVAWDDESHASPDTSGLAVRGRRFGPNGGPIGGDFVVNPTRPGNQKQAAVAGLNTGGFMAVLADDSQAGVDKSGFAVRGQRFTATGAKTGAPFQVNGITAGDQQGPALAELTNGRLAAAYQLGFSDTVRGQIFTPQGDKIGPEFRAISESVDNNRHPDIAALDSGNFAVVWTASGDDPDSRGSLNIMTQRFGPTGARIGGPHRVNRTYAGTQELPSVAYIGSNRYVVVWQDESQSGGDTNGLAVRGQIMSISGTRVGPELVIPTRRAGDQSEPAVAAFPNGRFVVVWTDDSGSPDDPVSTAVRGQLFSASGGKLGVEFRVNARTVGNQANSAIAALGGTDFVVLWTDASRQPPDQSASGVRGQVFRVTP